MSFDDLRMGVVGCTLALKTGVLRSAYFLRKKFGAKYEPLSETISKTYTRRAEITDSRGRFEVAARLYENAGRFTNSNERKQQLAGKEAEQYRNLALHFDENGSRWRKIFAECSISMWADRLEEIERVPQTVTLMLPPEATIFSETTGPNQTDDFLLRAAQNWFLAAECHARAAELFKIAGRVEEAADEIGKAKEKYLQGKMICSTNLRGLPPDYRIFAVSLYDWDMIGVHSVDYSWHPTSLTLGGLSKRATRIARRAGD